MQKAGNVILLFLTALIWGVAFVAQSVSMDYIGPLTFICLRFFIGGLFLIPVIWIFDKKKEDGERKKGMLCAGREENEPGQKNHGSKHTRWMDKKLIFSGIVCGIFLFGGSFFQQVGIQYTTVGKAGFITAFYIIIVPLFGLFMKKRCGLLTWIGVFVALLGLYFLCMTEALRIERGDFLVLIGAFMFAAQIMAVDYFNPQVDGVKMSCYQFLTGGVIGLCGMLLFESPSLTPILGAAVPILYTGIMSTGVGYTLQIVGQKGIHPAVAALILSMESVFSALSGFILLHQTMSFRELTGCILMFLAIILAQLPDFWRK